jgi:hypothetical protein
MTPIAGFIIAIIAGLMVRSGRRATAVVLAPWLVVLAYQSWYIASGRAISPPGTVTDFPSAIGYWLVQAIILAPALGIAAQLGAMGSRRHPDSRGRLDHPARAASALGLATSVIVILLGFVWFRAQGGTVFAGHHSTGGSPPVIGMVGLVLSFLTCGVLGVMTLRQLRAAKAARLADSGGERATARVGQ